MTGGCLQLQCGLLLSETLAGFSWQFQKHPQISKLSPKTNKIVEMSIRRRTLKLLDVLGHEHATRAMCLPQAQLTPFCVTNSEGSYSFLSATSEAEKPNHPRYRPRMSTTTDR